MKINIPVIKNLLSITRTHHRLLLIGMVILIIGIIAEALFPLIVKNIIDDSIPSGQFKQVITNSGIALILIIIALSCSFIQVYFFISAGIKIVISLKEKLFNHLLNLSMDYFDRTPPGKLIARVESDTQQIQELFSVTIMGLFKLLFSLTVILTMMFLNAFKLTLAIVLFCIPLIPITTVIAFILRKKFLRVRQKYAELTGFLAEYIKGIPIIQSYSQLSWAKNMLRIYNRNLYSQEVSTYFFLYSSWAILMSAEIIAIIILIYFGFFKSMIVITVGTTVMMIEYTRKIFVPLMSIGEEISRMQRGFAAAERAFGIFQLNSSTIEHPRAIQNIPVRWSGIKFNQVSFQYQPEQYALRNVNLIIPRGKTVALVGVSGAGKSTLINLLLRFYDPSSGYITLDDTDIRKFSLPIWRKNIGLILQDIFIFPGTILDNIRYFSPHITTEEVKNILELIGVQNFYEQLPRGLDTWLAEGGINLSLGERQIISFARALVNDPEILVMDEATSSIDITTELRMLKSLQNHSHHRTVIIIAHRLSTVSNADNIVVLDQGNIVQQGDHAELFQSEGIYKKLYRLQYKSE
jgi:ATP-binding cassette, subfamily B, multidrug efflux pump